MAPIESLALARAKFQQKKMPWLAPRSVKKWKAFKLSLAQSRSRLRPVERKLRVQGCRRSFGFEVQGLRFRVHSFGLG